LAARQVRDFIHHHRDVTSVEADFMHINSDSNINNLSSPITNATIRHATPSSILTLPLTVSTNPNSVAIG